jgi:hypothetical protein
MRRRVAIGFCLFFLLAPAAASARGLGFGEARAEVRLWLQALIGANRPTPQEGQAVGYGARHCRRLSATRVVCAGIIVSRLRTGESQICVFPGLVVRRYPGSRQEPILDPAGRIVGPHGPIMCHVRRTG